MSASSAFEADETCTLSEQRVACTRTPKPIPQSFGVPPHARILVGDLFTCASTVEGVWCWGASRDGFFGRVAACPKGLRDSWPTRSGLVRAPRAACSARPVKVASMVSGIVHVSAGPRGICVEERTSRRARCLGAISPPVTPALHGTTVSAGDDVGGCGIGSDDRLYCWGGGYSPASRPHQPINVAFERRVDSAAPVVDAAGPWKTRCKIRTSCDRSVDALPVCPKQLETRSWAEVVTQAHALRERTISVSGPLAIGETLSSAAGCEPAHSCCNRAIAPVALGPAPYKLYLAGLDCRGDESRLCCNAPAFGQTVVAIGELAFDDSSGKRDWTLRNPRLCEPAR